MDGVLFIEGLSFVRNVVVGVILKCFIFVENFIGQVIVVDVDQCNEVFIGIVVVGVGVIGGFVFGEQ